MQYELRSVQHETVTDDKDRFTLTLRYGCYGATVTVIRDGDDTDAQCHEVPADSSVDEFMIESFANEFVKEHGDLFGQVGTVLE